MALPIPLIKFFLNLHQKKFFNNLDNVLDMGDQDLGGNFEILKTLFSEQNIKINEEEFKRSKDYPNRPRVSSSIFWKNLGFKETHRLDIEKLSRDNKKDEENCFIADLNYPVNEQLNLNQYDLVTDFGNNEHPFNVAESYRSMHTLTKQNGYMFVAQNYINGNGFYNFDFPFFESIAMANNYKILSNFYVIYTNSYQDLILPIDTEIDKIINLTNAKGGIGINYMYQKTTSEEFKFPYQGTGTSIKRILFIRQSIILILHHYQENIYLLRLII